ncbi:dihydroneopterin aldolase family protein [Oxyplasma meridianum]|uniref:Dihydroneopterin aldolase n=1 Tax=Oxyplasma meridianum TaxID=3073602 RepID=A0AAX4NHV0_9ARCH
MQDPAQHYFKCTDRERAAFEAGIKLGTIYHQYVGIPINLTNLESLENAIRQSVLVQPFVKEAQVRIDRDIVNKRQGVYKYITLSGDMMDVSLTIKYREEEVKARLRYVPDMDYPLMYLEGD